MSEDLEGRTLVDFVDRHLDQTLNRMEEGLRPIWESQAELGKTLMSLSSGALVLSISVAQFFAGKIASPRWTWLLPTSWILFAVTVMLGATRQGWLGKARSLRAFLEQERSNIRGQLWKLQPNDELGGQVDAILVAAFQKAGEQPQKGIKIFDRLTIAMYWSFTCGLILLLIFAIKNLPF